MTASHGIDVLGTTDLSTKFFSFNQPNSENVDNFSNGQYVDPATLKHQKTASLTVLDDQVALAKSRAQSEYEMQRQAIILKADHELKILECTAQQSQAQQLFAVDQEFQSRRMEIETKAQEQRMQIEQMSSQLLLTAQQQRVDRDIEERMNRLQGSIPSTGSFSLPAWGYGSLQADAPK